MRINSPRQSLISSFIWAKEILNVKWILDYIKYEFIYWRWITFIPTPALEKYWQLKKFFNNTQKKSGLYKNHSVIGLDVFMTILKLNSLCP